MRSAVSVGRRLRVWSALTLAVAMLLAAVPVAGLAQETSGTVRGTVQSATRTDDARALTTGSPAGLPLSRPPLLC